MANHIEQIRDARAAAPTEQPPFLTHYDYMWVQDGNLDDLTEYVFDAGTSWQAYQSGKYIDVLLTEIDRLQAIVDAKESN